MTGQTMTELIEWGLSIEKVLQTDEAELRKLLRRVRWPDKKA